MVTPRMFLRLKKRLRRFDPHVQAVDQQEPADTAWHEMLRRLDADEAERRLNALESALNRE